MNIFQDRMSSIILKYNKTVDCNAFMFLDIHSKCSIWFRDFMLIEIQGWIKTYIKCNICKTEQLIGEFTFVRE